MDVNKLIQKIEELEVLNKKLIENRDQEFLTNFPWKENLGEWYWNIQTNHVVFNPLKVITLGYHPDEIADEIGFEFFTRKLHPLDYKNTMDAMVAHLRGKAEVYEVEYRIQCKDGSYKWFYDRGKITERTKDGKPVLLNGIVFDVTEKNRLLEELEEKNNLLQELISVDGLTKLKNYQSLILKMEEEVKRATALSVAIFDIDDFKQINDQYGHMYGNEVLQTIAQIMQDSVRGEDVVGRLGGEEFMIIYPETSLENAARVTERIRKKVEEHVFPGDVHITISAGVKQHDTQSIQKLMDDADMKMYQAKREGKNRVRY